MNSLELLDKQCYDESILGTYIHSILITDVLDIYLGKGTDNSMSTYKYIETTPYNKNRTVCIDRSYVLFECSVQTNANKETRISDVYLAINPPKILGTYILQQSS